MRRRRKRLPCRKHADQAACDRRMRSWPQRVFLGWLMGLEPTTSGTQSPVSIKHWRGFPGNRGNECRTIEHHLARVAGFHSHGMTPIRRDESQVAGQSTLRSKEPSPTGFGNRRHSTDQSRRTSASRKRLSIRAARSTAIGPFADDQFSLMFACCAIVPGRKHGRLLRPRDHALAGADPKDHLADLALMFG